MQSEIKRKKIPVMSIPHLENFPLKLRGLGESIRCEVTTGDTERWKATESILKKAFFENGEDMCPLEFLDGNMIISCWENGDMFDSAGDKIYASLMTCADELKRNSEKDNPLPLETALTVPANATLLKAFATISPSAAEKIRFHTSTGAYAPPILPTRVFAEPSRKEAKKRNESCKITGVESLAWDGKRAIHINNNRLRVMVPEDLPGFELNRLIETLIVPSYLHGTVILDEETNTWTIQPGATISTQQVLPLRSPL